MTNEFSRRGLLASTLGLGAVSVLTRSGLAQATPNPEGGWSVTDDRGITITLDTVPQNVIAQTISGASLWDFGIKVKGIYGDSVREDGTPDPQTGDMDLNQVEVLGSWASGLDLKKALNLNAQLFVDLSRSEDGALWSLDPEEEDALLAICPT